MQRLCADPRENGRLARLLSPTPLPSQQPSPRASDAACHAEPHATPAGTPATRSPPVSPTQRVASIHVSVAGTPGGGCSGAGSGRVGFGDADGAGGSEVGDLEGAATSDWSSVRTGTDGSVAAAMPVAFADVIEAFCDVEDAGAGSDHEAVASIISDLSHAADDVAAVLRDPVDASTSGAGPPRARLSATARPGVLPMTRPHFPALCDTPVAVGAPHCTTAGADSCYSMTCTPLQTAQHAEPAC